MRRSIPRAIRKTEVRLHRSMGACSIKLSKVDLGSLKKIRICGSSAFLGTSFREAWRVTSAEEGEDDRLELSLGSRNLLNYGLLPNLFKAKVPGKNILATAARISWTLGTDEFVLPLIDSSYVRFKPNRIYTVTLNLTFPAGTSGEASTGICLIYTDGTYDDITTNVSAVSNVKVSFASARGKTVYAVGVHGPTGIARYSYATNQFGIYEGDFSGRTDIFEPYIEPERITVPLDAPLRGIRGACDIVELISGVYQRNVEYVRFDSADGLSLTDEPHVFSTRLPTTVRDDLEIESPHPLVGEWDTAAAAPWISVGEDRRELFIYLPECSTLDEADMYLSAHGFGAVYAMQDTIERSIGTSLTEVDEARWLMLDTDYDPELFYAEYV